MTPGRDDDAAPNAAPLLRVSGLVKHFVPGSRLFRSRRLTVRAVDGVSFSVRRGEAVGLVGESGCGKSSAARATLRLIEPDAGEIWFDGTDLRGASGAALAGLRRRMQMVFQDPFSSLNPRRTIGQTLTEPLLVHRIAGRRAAWDRAAELLDEVGLSGAALGQFPHEFSGGQRQRIGLARALTVEPDLIIADEPVSALDVSVQAQVLLLMRRLQERRGLAFLFVSHDLGVVRWFCTQVCVMYLGRIVEQGSVEQVFGAPRHPYARVLRDASPVPDPRQRNAASPDQGEIPSAANPPAGCRFHPRCNRASKVCRVEYPPWTAGEDGGFACHHPIDA